MNHSLSIAQARALWWQKQALAGTTTGPIAAMIGASGWLRTLGGTDVYIAARARRPSLTRGELDAAVLDGALRVHPAVRGSLYLVPSAAVPDLLALNVEAWRIQTAKELGKLGENLAMVEALAPAVLATLSEPRSPDAIRAAFAGELPSFGEPGKKLGLASPLPLALRLLELAGTIERTLADGKLDSEHYLWRRTAGTLGPPAKDRAHRVANLVDAFLGFAAPATLAQLSAWAGRSQREIKTALNRLDAVPVTVERVGTAYVRAGDLDVQPRPHGVALLAFEDNYLVNHGLAAVTDPRHHAIEVAIWGSDKGAEALGTAHHVLSRSIVIDGLLAGFWDVDPRTRGAVWHTFDPAPRALAHQLDDLTTATATFVLDEIGHAKVFTMDTMDDVQRRADAIVRLGGKLASPRRAAPPAFAKPAKPSTKHV